MKKIFLFAAALLMSGAVFAQPGGGGFGGPPPGMMGMEQNETTISDPEEQAKEFVAQIKDSLQLDEKQEKSLVKLYTKHYSELQVLKAKISDREKATEQIMSQEILTTEQATAWKSLKKKLKRGNRSSNQNSESNSNEFNPGMMMPPPMMGGGPM